MDFMDKLVEALVFWFKWSLLIGFLFFASWFGLGVFDSTYGVLNLRAEGKEVQYWAIISIPVLIGLFWFLWSIVYVPVRHFILGYAFMVETCPSCKTQHGFTECPNCKGNKFLDEQCLVCGHQFDGLNMKCDECRTTDMKFRAKRSFEFDEDEEVQEKEDGNILSKLKKCGSCGKQLDDGELKCSKCGTLNMKPIIAAIVFFGGGLVLVLLII